MLSEFLPRRNGSISGLLVLPDVIVPGRRRSGSCGEGGAGSWQPGLACQRGADGVDRGESVTGSRFEVAADAAPAGERALGVPVPGDGLVPFGSFDARSAELLVHSTANPVVNSHT
jgi:hypothetical protein